jgi:hypothetical protein
VSDLSPHVQRLLETARSELQPGAEEVDALRVAVAARLGLASGASSAVKAGGTSTGAASGGTSVVGGLAGKAIAVVLLGAAAGGVAWGVRHDVRAPVAPPAVASHAPAAGPVPVASAPQGDAVPSAPRVSAPVEIPHAMDVGSAVTDLPVESLPRSPRTPEAQRVAKVPRLDPVSAPSIPAIAFETVPASPPSTTTPEAEAPSLAGETLLLREAHDALDRSDPQAALAKLREYDLRYPSGTLQEERLALRVFVLCALDRTEAARQAARQITRIAPHSAHLAGIRASCAGATPDE